MRSVFLAITIDSSHYLFVDTANKLVATFVKVEAMSCVSPRIPVVSMAQTPDKIEDIVHIIA